MAKSLLGPGLMFVSFLLSAEAQSSTFVGNGGNAGDFDVAITLAQIHETSKGLSELVDSLCQCPEGMEGSNLCKILDSLSSDQVAFCKKILVKYSKELSGLSSNKSPLKVNWSDQLMKVREEKKKNEKSEENEKNVENDKSEERLVDAVSRRETLEITIQRQRFLEMSESYRIALLTHELFHLISIEAGFVSDSQKLPPFKDGRSFLDTLGAATAMAAYELDVVADFKPLQQVSRSHKTNLVSISFENIKHKNKSAKKLFKLENSSAGALSYFYKPKPFGLKIGIVSIGNSTQLEEGIKASENLNLLSLGVSYHVNPIDKPMSRWSQTECILAAEVVQGSAFYKLADIAMSLEDRGGVLGAQATAQVILPFRGGLWGLLGYRARYLNYKYKKLGIETKEIQNQFIFGGAYGF